jgi:hypothetical protein
LPYFVCEVLTEISIEALPVTQVSKSHSLIGKSFRRPSFLSTFKGVSNFGYNPLAVYAAL